MSLDKGCRGCCSMRFPSCSRKASCNNVRDAGGAVVGADAEDDAGCKTAASRAMAALGSITGSPISPFLAATSVLAASEIAGVAVADDVCSMAASSGMKLEDAEAAPDSFLSSVAEVAAFSLSPDEAAAAASIVLLVVVLIPR